MTKSVSIIAVLLLSAAGFLSSCDGSNSTSSEQGTNGSTDTSNHGAPWNSNITYGTLTNAGQTYKTVTIGTQTWMAENLNYKVDSSWYYYGSNADSARKYGRLYTWASAMKLPDSCNHVACASQVQPKHQGVCPSGWHVPSDTEWTVLTTYIGGVAAAGRKLKSTSGWDLYEVGKSGNGTDAYGFRALPAGNRSYGGSFDSVESGAYFWSSSEGDASSAWNRYMLSEYDALSRGDNGKKNGFGVRCLKDGP